MMVANALRVCDPNRCSEADAVAAGWLTKVEGGTTTTYSYDAANELETEETPSKRVTYTYDANGNTETINDDGSLTTYSWDIENHIIKIEWLSPCETQGPPWRPAEIRPSHCRDRSSTP